MHRVLHHRQLGVFNSRDKQVLSNFLSKRFDELLADLSAPQADHVHQTIFMMCENILNTLYHQKIDVRKKANALSNLYDRFMAQIPDFEAKKLYLQFCYHEAMQHPNIALIVLSKQNNLRQNIFTENEMLKLIDCVRYKQSSYRYYITAIGHLANYYFRLAETNPAYLINYALYLAENAITGNTPLAIGLNALLMNQFSTQELMVLFPHWSIARDAQSNAVTITNNQRQLSLTDFITTISIHSIIFAAVAYNQTYDEWEKGEKPIHHLFPRREPASLIARRSHLINCIQKLSTLGHALPSAVHQLLCDLAKHKVESVSACAKHTLETYKIANIKQNAG